MVGILTSSLANAMMKILAPSAILAYVNFSTPMPFLALVLITANGTFHAEGTNMFKVVARMKNMERLNACVLMKASLSLHLEEDVDAGEGVGVLYEEATERRLNIMIKQTMTNVRRICP